MVTSSTPASSSTSTIATIFVRVRQGRHHQASVVGADRPCGSCGSVAGCRAARAGTPCGRRGHLDRGGAVIGGELIAAYRMPAVGTAGPSSRLRACHRGAPRSRPASLNRRSAAPSGRSNRVVAASVMARPWPTVRGCSARSAAGYSWTRDIGHRHWRVELCCRSALSVALLAVGLVGFEVAPCRSVDRHSS